MAKDTVLGKLATAITESDDLEGLVRPLLELLESLTGLESTYLTSIDLDNRVQRVQFARNARDLTIPEGLEVSWEDTLCKRALDEQRPYADDVDVIWGDSDAARELGIRTYLSEPIRVAEGELYGTLCGASVGRVPVTTETCQLLEMFARLIARQIERDRLLARLREENREYSHYALTDPLTGIPNRRALERELNRTLAAARRQSGVVHLAFIDLDGFKAINDQYGHDVGDRFLIQMAGVIREGLREEDYVARYGGDEFIVFARGADDHDAGRGVIAERLARLTTGLFHVADLAIDYAGPSIGVVTSTDTDRDCDRLLARADAEMYRIKKLRRARGLQGLPLRVSQC